MIIRREKGLGAAPSRNQLKTTPFNLAIKVINAILCTTNVFDKHDSVCDVQAAHIISKGSKKLELNVYVVQTQSFLFILYIIAYLNHLSMHKRFLLLH